MTTTHYFFKEEYIKHILYTKMLKKNIKSVLLYIPILTTIILFSLKCNTIPSNFNLKQVSNNTNLIDTTICYITQLGCIENLFLITKFSNSGKTYSATTSSIDKDILACFQNPNKNSVLCRNILEGNYSIKSDTIYTQTIRKDGMGFVIFREFKINNDQNISLISDYIEPKYTQVGFAQNYPSFYSNSCSQLCIKTTIQK